MYNTDIKNIFITGAAGFIGFHVSKRMLNEGYSVVAIDNLNDYYDVNLKLARLKILQDFDSFHFIKGDIADRQIVASIFTEFKPEIVIHLAAQAGVRYSIINPYTYIDSNVYGFLNILEGCRHAAVKHLVYASSSSVYGANTKIPFSVDDPVDEPVSLYAATKRANELMAYSYSHLYGIPSTGLRFFTVYGPWGRPDMAYFSFAKKILEGEAIDVFNHGDLKRDFTYIDDVVEGVVKIMHLPPNIENKPLHKIYNIGNNQPIEVNEFITTLETALGKKAVRNNLPMQAGDVPITYADIDALGKDTGFRPSTSLKEGIENFVGWYKSYLDSCGQKEI